MNQALINEERTTLIARLFTLGGTVLFFIGSFVTVNVAVQSYNRMLTERN
ncbi:hypothetical protein [Psychrobacillus sp. NPDC096389]